MKTYTFKITLRGNGKDENEAWRDACEALSMDNGETPEDFKIDEEE